MTGISGEKTIPNGKDIGTSDLLAPSFGEVGEWKDKLRKKASWME